MMPEKGENALVAWLSRRFPPDPARVAVGIGDDMAVLRTAGEWIAVTADMLLDGVHFDTGCQDLGLIGRKAIACSLSDCAAMACNPLAATISLALPNGFELSHVKALYEGMAGIADEFGCRMVGGDTTSWPGRLAIDVGMLAEPMAGRGPLLRSRARPGDSLFVSGPLGGSILGRHLTFTPRLDVARALAGRDEVHAMMDLSDGLSLDLHRMCEASGCDAVLEAHQLDQAISADALRLSQSDPAASSGHAPASARLHALNDGEDFELLIAGDVALKDTGLGLIPVGRMVPREPRSTRRVHLLEGDSRRPVEPRGYEHFT